MASTLCPQQLLCTAAHSGCLAQARQYAAATSQRLETASSSLAASQETSQQLQTALAAATGSAGSLQGSLAAQQAASAQKQQVSLPTMPSSVLGELYAVKAACL